MAEKQQSAESLQHNYVADLPGSAISDVVEKPSGSATPLYAAAAGPGTSGGGLRKSRFDTLSITQALWVFRRSLFVCFCVFTGRMLQYWETVTSMSLIANPGFVVQFGDPARGQQGVAALNPQWVSAWSAIVNACQILIILTIPYMTERYGRKPSLLLAWFFVVMAMVCLTAARRPSVWLAGRLFTGLGTGIIAVLCAPYGMEICANQIRGIVLSAAIFWGALATLMASVMLDQLTQRHPMNWLLPIYATWAPVGLMGLCFAVIPESPWFHARRGDKDKAIKVLQFLYGNVEGYDYEEEYGIIARTIEHEREQIKANQASSWTDLFKGTNGKRTLAALIITISLQFGGFPILYMFATYTYALAGFSNPFQTVIITASVQCAVVLLMVATFDKFGRRRFVTAAYSFQAISMLLWGCMHYVDPTAKGRMGGLTFVACFWAFTATITANSTTIYTTELPAAYIRIKTGVLCSIVDSCIGIAANFATPPMLLHLGLRSGFIFFAFAMPVALFLWLYLPETKGRSAAEIDELYESKVPAWRWAKTRTAAEEQLAAAMKQRAREEDQVYSGVRAA